MEGNNLRDYQGTASLDKPYSTDSYFSNKRNLWPKDSCFVKDITKLLIIHMLLVNTDLRIVIYVDFGRE